ncbi:MAG: coproporphyrinogen III oxidase family protein [Eggerthellaceae bacterium]|nr:coproporphyrinogen III oxidase family protein [Eggerthellaceae bacterium]
MLSEKALSAVVRTFTDQYLKLHPTDEGFVPGPEPGRTYMLYAHVPFCQVLCPYCSFNRFPYEHDKAKRYFENLRREMRMMSDLGFDFESLYIGGGTPTIMIDELCETIDLARELFSLKEVSSETNPNHLIPSYVEKLEGRVQRLSVGVQSFDDGLLKQMARYDKYGSGDEIFERIQYATPHFTSLNVDMIFNFPAQTPDILIADVERIIASGTSQTTFYPLMASPSVQQSMANSVGKVDYTREQLYYQIICELLTGQNAKGEQVGPRLYEHGSAWTFNRRASEFSGEAVSEEGALGEAMIDEYVVNYEEYPAIGSGGITYLGGNLYVNTFSVNDYNADIEAGHMSLMGKTEFSLLDRMRYRFMMQLFGLRLDKRQFREDFGVDIEKGLPIEMAFMRLAGAFDHDDENELTLTPMGRYLLVVMMRQFFIGVNNLRDQARAALTGEERKLFFSE